MKALIRKPFGSTANLYCKEFGDFPDGAYRLRSVPVAKCGMTWHNDLSSNQPERPTAMTTTSRTIKRNPTRQRGGKAMPNVERIREDGERWLDVILVRISVDRANETSTETQEDECRAFSAMFNGNVVAVVVERGQSAYKQGMHRDGLERALRMLETGQANRLVVWKLDRLMRDVHDFSRVLLRLQESNVHLVSRTEPWVDTTSPMGYGIVHIIAAAAEIESQNKSDRQSSFLKGRANGNPLVPAAAAPFGYDKPAPNTLVINPDEQRVLHEIARRIMEGESLRKIARDLNARGVFPKSGKPWSHASLSRAVTTPTVIAHAAFDGTLIPSTNWEPALDVPTFNTVRAILDDPMRDINRGALTGQPMVIRHTLSGVIKCGAPGCNGVLLPFGQQGRLRCNQHGCKLSVVESTTEDFISECLLSMVSESDWHALKARGRSVERQALSSLTSKLEWARREWLADRLSNDEWSNVQRDIAEMSASLADAESLDLPDWDSLREGWATADATVKRTVINTVFESITAVPRGRGCNGTERIKILPRVFDGIEIAA